jgi:arginyl-tRNA synthetase
MAKDKYKEQFAAAVAEAFRRVYPDACQKVGDQEPFAAEAIYNALVKPKDPTMGRFAYPVFRHAGLLGAKPNDISQAVSAAAETILASNMSPLHASSAGGYINGPIDPVSLTADTLGSVASAGNDFGNSATGYSKTCLVEYSSPNIAKPFGVGHLRSTIIGHSLRRIFKKLGYNTIGINYPGDWGTQFGKMIVAYRRWGDEQALEGDAVKNLVALYVRFHDEAQRNTALEDEARLAFKELEQEVLNAAQAQSAATHRDIVKAFTAALLWRKFKDISNAEFERVYGLLGVDFDWVYGESDLNTRMEPLIERLQRAGLTQVSEGALVVQLEDENLPPVLLKKGDGATLYATRDLAGMVYRWEKYPGFDKSLYVVNSAQSDHFKQIFKVMAMLEDAEQVPPEKRMTGHVEHVDFGWVRFGGKSMSTRAGNTVLLEDVIAEATALVKEKIREKNPDLKAIDETAHMIGVGAVIFSQLAVRRQRDVDFQWEEVLSFEGETGPYLQYTHARLCSLLRRYGKDVTGDVDYCLLNLPEEQRVVELLADFPGVVVDAGEYREPSFIAQYLLKLAGAFNKVYQRKDEKGASDKIISDDARLSAARIALVKSVQIVVNEGLHLLGLQAPEEM